VADRRERPLTVGKTTDLRERPGGDHLRVVLRPGGAPAV